MVSLLLAVALAPGSPVEVEWRSDEGCPGPEWGHARVEAFLNAPLESASDRGPLTIRVDLRRVGEAYSAGIAFAEDGSARAFEDPDCSVLAEVAAFVVASNVDPSVEMVSEPEPEPVTDPEPISASPPAGPVEPEPVTDPEPATEAPGAPRVRVVGGAAASLRPGLVPGVGPGVDAALGVWVGRVRADVRGFWTPGARSAATNSAPSARVQAGGGVAALCYGAVVRPRLDLPLCAMLELGAVRAFGVEGLVDPQPSTRLTIGAGVGARLTWWLTPNVGLAAGAAFLGMVRRPAFTAEGGGTVFTGWPVAIVPELGLEFGSR